ncbi:MAG TPA: hypothetical protein PLQ76_09495 [bacterium]|nr:hypothetical protein [bacterium]
MMNKIGQLSQAWDIQVQQISQQSQLRRAEDVQMQNPNVRSQDSNPVQPKIEVPSISITT